MMIEGKINKNKTKIVFDIGASNSIMSDKFAREHNFKINKSDINVKLMEDQFKL